MISEHLQIVTKVKKQVMWPVHWWVISKICHYFFNQSYVLSNMREAGTSGLCSRKKTSYKIPLRFKLITDSTAVKPHLTAYHMAHLYVSMTIKQSNVIVFLFPHIWVFKMFETCCAVQAVTGRFFTQNSWATTGGAWTAPCSNDDRCYSRRRLISDDKCL